MSSEVKRSVSLYSYQDEYYDKKLDLEGCLQEVAKTGATGVELLAEQMIRQFPDPIYTDEFREKWFGWMRQYGLTPTCYDAFLENRIYDNRTLSLGEQINMMKRDIGLASLLGFTSLRTLASTPMDVIEGSLDYAAEKNVRIGVEVHSPFSLNSEWADGYLDIISRTGTKHFGFVPDLGIFCRNIPDVIRDKARRLGANEECLKIVDDAYAERTEKGFTKIKYALNLGEANLAYRKANGLNEMTAALEKAGAGEGDFWYMNTSYCYTWCDPQDIIDNIQYVVHTHAKFYSMHENYEEDAVDIPAVVAAYKKAGYTGYLSSEYEGGESLRDALEVDSVEQVRRHQEALRRAIEG